MLPETNSNNLSDVCTASEIVNEYPELFTNSQLHWLKKTRHKNGLHETSAVLKVSRKLYLKKSAFIGWFMNQKAS